ncbi:MAG: hypothetical protein JXR70_18370 [Spirochaetales bacterium]|nr:hypothetical protein [Spirochaetales bacterium]
MMRGILLICLVVFLGFSLYGLEVGIDYRIGNLALGADRAKSDTTFDGMDFSAWGLDFYAKHKINDNVTIETNFMNDPILRNIGYTQFFYRESILNIGVGPFFGFFNSGLDPILKPGISTIVQLELPGLFFVSFRADSTQNSRLNLDLDYTQERTDVQFGFYVPNAICTINLLNRQYTQKSGMDEIVDSLNEYSFKAEIFQKNTPYKLFLSFGLENLGKNWINSTETVQQYLNSFIVGTALDMNISRGIYIYLDVTHSIYTWGDADLLGIHTPGPGGYMFRGWAGFRINFDQLIPEPPVS